MGADTFGIRGARRVSYDPNADLANRDCKNAREPHCVPLPVIVLLLSVVWSVPPASAQSAVPHTVTDNPYAPVAGPANNRRIALVIGNGGYRKVARLTNPSNDAALIAKALTAAHFTLIGGGPQVNLDKANFDAMVQKFGRQIVGADVALFYYAGHGLQVRGENWLVPVDAAPSNVQDLDFQMVDAGLVLRQMQEAGTKLNLLILDACRNNPFSINGSRAVSPGLGQMEAPEGTLISYATEPNDVARDGDSGDSPYTIALANAIQRRSADLFQVFNQVGLDERPQQEHYSRYSQTRSRRVRPYKCSFGRTDSCA